MYADQEKASAIDGLASHWYSHSAYDVLQKAHAVRPDKFILATEVGKASIQLYLNFNFFQFF
jgi:hypothetical protein